MNEDLRREKVENYLSRTKKALSMVKITAPERSHARRVAEDFFQMAQNYTKDAEHFLSQGNLVNAFACVNYAHGWIDAGARLGLFDVDTNDKLFTLAW